VEPAEDRKFKFSMVANLVFHIFYLMMSLFIIFAQEKMKLLTTIIDATSLIWYLLLLGYFIECFCSIMWTTKRYFIFEYNNHKCYFVFMAVVLFISLIEFILQRYSYLHPQQLKFSGLSRNVLDYIETFILLAPVSVYLFFKKVEDCLGCFNKCSVSYSNHQFSIHDTIFKQENKRIM